MANSVNMTTLINEIKSIRETLQEDIKRSDENVNKKLDAIQASIQPLGKELEFHSKELKILKQENHRKRLIIFGVDGDPEEEKSILEIKVQSLLVQTLSLADFSMFEMDFCRRVGRRTHMNRPITIGLTTERRKEQILRSSKLLKGTSISIREDFPPEIREKRKNLLVKMRKLRAEGKFAIVKYDQLITRDNKKTTENNTPDGRQGQKRAPSQSPGIIHYKRMNWDSNLDSSSEHTPSRGQGGAALLSSSETNESNQAGYVVQMEVTDELGSDDNSTEGKN
ncbi:hypothetical protein M8J77_001199 [Diaphorina citri]|nr:hypothetical protein M8J77_001199 [Diaphorina citri]